MAVKRFQVVDGKMIENGNVDCPVLIYINPDDEEKRHLIDQLKID